MQYVSFAAFLLVVYSNYMSTSNAQLTCPEAQIQTPELLKFAESQEKLMANTLKFYMSVPTPYVFMRRFLKVAQSDKKLELLSFFMIELCLVEYDMLKYSPLLLAAVAVYTARCTLQGYRNWSRASEWHSKYTKDQLLECSRLTVDFHQKAASGKLTGVHRKYNTFKFGYAARAAPA